MSVTELVSLFDLKPHPEGGYYKQTYRSTESVGERALSTAILYLLAQGGKSNLHRIKSDEMWHFHLGDPLIVVEILADGSVQETVLGHDVGAGQKLQHVVPAGIWFGAYPGEKSQYSLVGCTVSPGFDFSDFELGSRAALGARYPLAVSAIERLTDG